MSTSIYSEKLVEPTDKMLTQDLGTAKVYLNKISEFIDNEYGEYKTEWKFYNQSSGWILKMFTKKRNVLFIVPCENCFRAAFILCEKATDAVYNSDLPESIKKHLFEAQKYAEGRSVQFEVRTETDLDNVLKLIRIKLSN